MKRSRLRVLASLALGAALVATLGLLWGCGANSQSGSDAKTAGTADNAKTTVLKVGASPAPHAEILESVKDTLAEQGIELLIIEYSDYVLPNTALQDGDIDANYFQHKPYLDDFNAEHKSTLVSVAAVHFEPLAIYAGKSASVSALPDGARIAVPNDTTNEARALLLLQDQGLITLPANADLTVTPRDIVDNPKNLEFLEVEAAALPRELEEVDLAVINGNFALAADLPTSLVLATEDPDSLAATTYANCLVVKEGNEDNAAIKALIEALTSQHTRDFIADRYQGVVVPVF